MAQIFISHSKEDLQGRTFLANHFASAENTKAYFYILEHPKPPHAPELRKQVFNSVGVIILMSDYLINTNIHTAAWISYEVGLAHAFNKPVLLLEAIPEPQIINVIQSPEIQSYTSSGLPQSVQSQIPGTKLILQPELRELPLNMWPSRLPIANIDYLYYYSAPQSDTPPEKYKNEMLQDIINSASFQIFLQPREQSLRNTLNKHFQYKVQCMDIRCRAQFKMTTTNTPFICPVCREINSINESLHDKVSK